MKTLWVQRSALSAMSIFFHLQVIKTGVNPCKPEQYTVLKANKLHTCKDCGRCGEGFAPSPPCGDTIGVNTILECKSCVLGETFSDDFSTGHCKFCTVCNRDQVVKRNCTHTANRVCDTKCKSNDTYFDSTVTDDCQKCSKCCGLASDKREQECVDKAMPSYQQCNVNTATRCTTMLSTRASSTIVYSSNENSVRPLDSKQPTITRETLMSNRSTRDSVTKTPSIDEELISPGMIALIAILIILSLALIALFVRQFWNKTQTSDENLSNSEGGSIESDVTTDGSRYPLLDKKCLAGLCEVPEYHNICLLLECKPPKIKPKCGDYTDIGKHYDMKYEEICCLQNSNPGERAHALFEFLKSRFPNLTVKEFAVVLSTSKINRTDVLKILHKYIKLS